MEDLYAAALQERKTLLEARKIIAQKLLPD
jgi:hypothetical protein